MLTQNYVLTVTCTEVLGVLGIQITQKIVLSVLGTMRPTWQRKLLWDQIYSDSLFSIGFDFYKIDLQV